MKKSIMMIICIFSPFIHGMEKEELSSFNIVYNGTTVNVKSGCIFEANNKVDLIVINKHHQKKLDTFVVDYYSDKSIKEKSLIPQKFYYTMLIPDHTNPTSTNISLEEAKKKIAEYVTLTLEKSFTKIGLKKKEKTIALTPLSTKSGFLKDHLILGTTTGIFTFITEYPYAFDYIELIVEDPRDIGTYADSFLSIQEYLMNNAANK